MRVKAKLKGDVATVKLLIKHEMETGRRKNELGKLIPAKYVQTITGHIKQGQVFEVNSGPGVSKNPFLQVVLSGRKAGETLVIKWLDSSGESEETSITLKA